MLSDRPGDPVLRAAQGLVPFRAPSGSLRRRHRGVESLVDAPVARQRLGRIPEAHGEAREVRRAQRGRFGHLRPHDRNTKQVGLELHQRVVGGGAAVHPELLQRDAGVAVHGLEQIGDLESDALDGGPRDMAGRRASRDPHDRAARVRIPVRRPESGEGRHEIDAAVVRDGPRQRLDIGRRLDHAQPVAQPLDHGAADEDAALERIAGLAADLPGHRREQPIARHHRALAGVLQQKAAGAVGVLRHARRDAHLAEERGLLIPGDPGDRDIGDAERRRDPPVDRARRPDLRQQARPECGGASADRRPISAC